MALLRLTLSYCTGMCHSSHLQLLASPSLETLHATACMQCRDLNFISTAPAVYQLRNLRRRAPGAWKVVSQLAAKRLSQPFLLILTSSAPFC
ncbi:hypothetical protein B0T16DRAFT_150943 [Cercophora newfieldiana]|uniref:Uncharacterized protein n=1 Tax=Cercophora newfieldiana TaxID=92897 RepID=A0AA40CP16_9PEZI|nr:hypothetical protein B0T16DRAFT_150943 [Cercophora newfieldiana]